MQAKRYKITVNGHARYYETLRAARDDANEIFARTGTIVGIEAAHSKPSFAPSGNMYRGRMIDGNMYRGR